MTHSVFKLYDFFPELSDLYFLLKPSLTMKTEVRIREFILGSANVIILLLVASLYWVLKSIQGKAGHQNTLNKRFSSLAN